MFTILGADGKEYGPVATEKIAEWIRGGRANLQTRARRDGETEWKTLREFPEFAQTAAPSAVPPLPSTPVVVSSPAAPGARPTPVYRDESLAGRGARLVARIIDLFLSGFSAMPGLALMALGGVFTRFDRDDYSGLAIAGVALACLGFVILFIFQVYLLSTRGQTIGKIIMSVRVVNFDDGKNPGFVKAFLLRAFVNGCISSCVPFYGIVDMCFIFRDDKRCIHDLIASTKVVKAK
ncbi:RDD family protein [Oleiharenicola lentus]|uniref:RDD family protein n=1 Tax=Oleiharenicola lentus TaxID=2508720 RepID=UPI003F665D49